MESNFIKERIVIREKIIKKNLADSKRVSSFDAVNTATPGKAVVALEEFINDKLKKDLADVVAKEEKLSEVISDYLKIKSALKVFKLSAKRGVKIQTNLGCEFYAQCQIEDASKVYICVGKDIYLHMELDEAIKMIDFKENQLRKQMDELQLSASKIKAYIKLVLESLGRLYELDNQNSIND